MLRKEALSGLAAEQLAEVLSSRLRLALQPVHVPRAGGRGAPNSPGSRFDLAFDLRGIEPPRRLYVEVKSRYLREHLRAFVAQAHQLRLADPRAVPLLLVPRLSRRSRDELREAGVNHADLSGVVFIRDAGLYLDLEGLPQHHWSVREADRLGAYADNVLRQRSDIAEEYRINPFSDKASLVLRVLLSSADRPRRHSEISAQAQVTKGWVSQVAGELVKRGYVEREENGLRLSNSVGVLKDWAAVYTWRRNRMESFVAPFEYEDLLSRGAAALSEVKVDWALTLLAGVDRVSPHVQHGQVHAYVAPADYGRSRSAVRKGLHLEPVAQGGNFHLLEPYYAKSAFYGRREVGGLPVVSDVQLYLDLSDYPVRGSEAVEMLLRGRLGPALGLDSRQIGELV